MPNNKAVKPIAVIFLLFAALTFLISFIASYISAEYYSNNTWFIPLYLILYTSVCVVFRKYFLAQKHTLTAVIILCFAVRLIAVLVLKVAPASDYLYYHETAVKIKDGIPLLSRYGAVFPHTLGYSAVIAFIYRIFGVNYFYIQIFNTLISALTAFLTYKVSCRIFDRKTGIFAAFLYSVSACFILYNEILATETLFTLLVLCAAMLIQRKPGILPLAVFGLTAAAANIIRPCGIVIILAALIYLFVCLKGNFIRRVTAAAVMILVYVTAMSLIFGWTNKLNGIETATAPIGYNIFIGSNAERFGVWNESDAHLADQFINNLNLSPNEVHRILLKLGIERFFSNGIINNIKFLFVKFGIMWGSGALVNYYLLGDASFAYFGRIFGIAGLLNGFHIMLFGGILSGAFYMLRKRKTVWGILFVLGIAAQHLLAETMERYAYTSIVLMLPVAAFGMLNFYC